MPCCCAVNCSNRDTRGYSLYRFPSDPVRRDEWIQNCKRSNWTPTVGSRLCEEHFEEQMFENYLTDNGRRKLKPNAVPTRFPFPNPTKLAFDKLIREKRALKKKNRLKRKRETAVPIKVIVQEHSYNKLNREVKLRDKSQILRERRRAWKELRLRSMQRTLENVRRKVLQEKRTRRKYQGILARLCLQGLDTQVLGFGNMSNCKKRKIMKKVSLLLFVEKPTMKPAERTRNE